MQPASELFHPEAATAIRDAIAATGGNEVFFVGRPGPGHVVAEVQVLARGHDHAVPAVMSAVRPGEVVIHNHPSGMLVPSEPDLAIASQGSALGIAFIIVDNLAERAYVVVEPRQLPERVPLSLDDITRAFGPDGELASSLAGYEHRTQQVTMAAAVAAALNDDGVTMIEAGTGTGKSLAYLLPAILFATRNHERVVVSTNTINLQEQLLGSDLPFLRDQLGLEFKSVLLKGRSNYLCLRKTEFAEQEQEKLFDDSGRATFKAIADWSRQTANGSRSELPFVVPAEVWTEVASDADDCMRVKSPFHGRCFFYNSRREAASADVIVVNHHLLMADLATRAATNDYTSTAVLPPYSRIVLDEAHNLEDVAASYFGGSVTGLGILSTLGRLVSGRDEGRGALVTLARTLERDAKVSALLDRAITVDRRALIESVRVRFAAIADGVCGYLGVDDPGSDELKLRLTRKVLTHPGFREGVVDQCAELTRELGEYASLLARLLRGARLGATDNEAESALMRVEAIRLRLEAAAALLAVFPKPPNDHCHWVEVSKRRGGELAPRLHTAPMEVGELLATQVYSKLKSVVLTSATLTVGRRFAHFADRLGVARVAASRVTQVMLDSPFDFRRQARVFVPTDMPEPREPTFAAAVCDAVEQAIAGSAGRAFILFTAYGLLDRCHRVLSGRLEPGRFNLLKQGTAPRAQLLERFRRERGSVLFAVDSFWEGVDVPGDALSLVVLVRLPFRVPTEPLQEARVETIEQAGGDPFAEYTVPQAVIKFRQGFGRLIRTRTDRGAVVILDSRVITKPYGRVFLDSLPDVEVVTGPRAVVMDGLRSFYATDLKRPGL